MWIGTISRQFRRQHAIVSWMKQYPFSEANRARQPASPAEFQIETRSPTLSGLRILNIVTRHRNVKPLQSSQPSSLQLERPPKSVSRDVTISGAIVSNILEGDPERSPAHRSLRADRLGAESVVNMRDLTQDVTIKRYIVNVFAAQAVMPAGLEAVPTRNGSQLEQTV